MGKNKFNYITLFTTLLVAIIIVGYSIFNFRIFIAGPTIEITNLENGQMVEKSLINLQGKAYNTAFIEINDRPILVESSGNFEESILLYPGYNVIKIHAKDQFEREIEQKLEIVFEGEMAPTLAISEDNIVSEELENAEEAPENATSTEEI